MDRLELSRFLGGKTDLARALGRGELGGGYEEAILILSSIVAAFAAQLWPRPEREWRVPEKEYAKLVRHFPDQKRFVEFWVTYADPLQNSTNIAVPLLAEYLDEFERMAELTELKRFRPNVLRYFPEQVDGNVVTCETADASEAVLLRECPTLTKKDVRWWSYPAVFYREVRSGFVHELNATQTASHRPAGSSGEAITYRNDMRRPHRRIHFELEWLCTVVEQLADRAHADWNCRRARCGLRWWIDGA